MNLHRAVLYGDITEATAAIVNGANVHGFNEYNQTALELAVANGHSEMVTVLLNNGAVVCAGALHALVEPARTAQVADLILNSTIDPMYIPPVIKALDDRLETLMQLEDKRDTPQWRDYVERRFDAYTSIRSNLQALLS